MPVARDALALRENNINQTAASAAASIVSGGLVAPIPALTMLTGQTLPWFWLIAWVFLVSILGVFVAAGLREAMLERERLPFPAGVATAETLREIHAKHARRGAQAAGAARRGRCRRGGQADRRSRRSRAALCPALVGADVGGIADGGAGRA